ncbi:hypothetical protein [Apibacter adventoris]|uniref:hypothetical protein n=1 Tax=Apibacter adventoris TaxID=1679466 RepID=UPI000CF6F9FA|nr:hypothetical protein [Apibacter adventoris]PQL93860.1 hypothetical protein C4S76_07195 [Apibacter adventoris]
MKKGFGLVLVLFFFFISCKKEYTTVDGSSKDNFNKSIESISSKLTILQQDKIQEAIKLIYKFRTEGTDETKRWEELYELLNGKNADQIFDIAEEVAKENKISWSSTSMNTLDSSVFDEELKSMTLEEEKLKQIEAATKINLHFSPVSNNVENNDGFYLYPELVDEEGNSITYDNLPLSLSISFINNGTVVYVTKKTITSSEAGNPSLKKGIKIPYNMFDKNKVSDARVDVEIKANAGEKYLYGKLKAIPIDLSKTKEVTNSVEDEINNQVSVDNVKSFIQNIGNKNYSKAYSLTKNPKWDTEEKFASTSNGFGTVEATNLLTTEVINTSRDKITIFALYQIKDQNGKVKTLKQNFILKKDKDNWFITDTETKEIKEDTWK